MTDNEKSERLFANDGTNWRSQRSPVSTKEAREADKALDDAAREGEGPGATNEARLLGTIVEGSEESNRAASGDAKSPEENQNAADSDSKTE